MSLSLLNLNASLFTLYDKSVADPSSVDLEDLASSINRFVQIAHAPGQSRAAVALVEQYVSLFCLQFPLDSLILKSQTEQVDGDIQPAVGQTGVSIVTCSMNRSQNLLRALPTWLDKPVVSEIVIIDWSSDMPVAEDIKEAGLLDPRVRVLRVENETRWNLTRAFNLGFRVACGAYILKLDADIMLSPDFFRENTLQENSFIAGNWRTAAAGQSYVNGLCFAPRDALSLVHGFNEFISSYGWDDEDLYLRLKRAGFSRLDVAAGSVAHIDHSDAERLNRGQASDITKGEFLRSQPSYSIHRNRYLVKVLPVWGRDRRLSRFFITGGEGQVVTVQGDGNTIADIPPVFSESAAALGVRHECAKSLGKAAAAERAGQRAWRLGLPADQSLSRGLPAPSLSRSNGAVFIDAQHGLGNRLRAIGSGAALAKELDRELVIVWQPDVHCECRFSDLFSYGDLVIGESFVADARAEGMTVFNYMPLEFATQKDALIEVEDGRDLYIRSAFQLNHPSSTWKSVNQFLRELTFSASVDDLLTSVEGPYDIGVHIRMQSGAEHLPYESESNWSREDHRQIQLWRQQSHYQRFVDRLSHIIGQNPDVRLFVASDTQEAYTALGEAFGSNVSYLPRTVFDRSHVQLQFALADAVALSRTPWILGSSWSSFTELARRLSPHAKQQYELSGRDF